MTLLHLNRPPLPPPLSSPSHRPPPLLPSRFKPISSSSLSSEHSLPSRIAARDRIIDFGKHKGKMLGTLPSTYLLWVSKNLRARDSLEWALLADEVLQDPFYRDRVEWESAEKILTGDRRSSTRTSGETPVAELLEISEQFGWDNDDKDGWSRVDFDLLGTSKGGRIPRVSDGGEEKGDSRVSDEGLRLGMERRKLGDWSRRRGTSNVKKNLDSKSGGVGKSGILGEGFWVQEARKVESFGGRRVGFLSKGSRFTFAEEESNSEEEEEVVREKREERRGRQRVKREQQMKMLKREVGVEGDGSCGVGVTKKEHIGWNKGFSNPFPGRGALFHKMKGDQ